VVERANMIGRNGAIWREYCRGATMEGLADKYGLSFQRISQIIAEVRDTIPQQTRQQLIQQEIDFLNDTRSSIMADVYDSNPAPVTIRDGEGWRYLKDPVTDEYVVDHTARLTAARVGLDYSKFIADVLGLKAATKVDLGPSEEAAAVQQAADAVAHLHGETSSGEEQG
jgi:Mor transcription activator family